jgi:hypothetical protein
MTKEETKQIREIASRLPKGVVRTPTYELFQEPVRKADPGERFDVEINYGRMVLKRGETIDVEVNHERRLRRAYKKHGMAGVRHYFEYVRNQIDKQEQVAGLPDTPGS